MNDLKLIKLNENKTKIMKMNMNSDEVFKINDNLIKKVEHITYLGKLTRKLVS